MFRHEEVREKLLNKYGTDGQLLKLLEEMKELSHEIEVWFSPEIKEKNYEEVFARLKDEFVDVFNIMLGLKPSLFLSQREFDDHMGKKIDKAEEKYL